MAGRPNTRKRAQEALAAEVVAENVQEVPAKKIETKVSFDAQDKDLNDVCLIVGNRKFYCSKHHLSQHADYFKSMFGTQFAEANKKEIELHDVTDPEVFHAFLLLINGVAAAVDDANVEAILGISKLWFADVPRDACNSFLMHISKKTAAEKIKIAKEYDLKDLMRKVINDVYDISEFALFVPAQLSEKDSFFNMLVLEKSLQMMGVRASQARARTLEQANAHSQSLSQLLNQSQPQTMAQAQYQSQIQSVFNAQLMLQASRSLLDAQIGYNPPLLTGYGGVNQGRYGVAAQNRQNAAQAHAAAPSIII